MIIRATESFVSKHAPERGTVRFNFVVEGPDKEASARAVTTLLAAVCEQVKQMHDREHGPVTKWTQGEFRTSASRPWNHEGKQLPWVFRSSAPMSVRFSDFGKLFAFIEGLSGVDGIEIEGVDWTLTHASEESLISSAQVEAVERLTRKALRLALAAGANSITPLVIADPGLLVTSTAPVSPYGDVMPTAMRAMAYAESAAGGGPTLEFRPTKIAISATVQGEFEAS